MSEGFLQDSSLEDSPRLSLGGLQGFLWMANKMFFLQDSHRMPIGSLWDSYGCIIHYCTMPSGILAVSYMIA